MSVVLLATAILVGIIAVVISHRHGFTRLSLFLFLSSALLSFLADYLFLILLYLGIGGGLIGHESLHYVVARLWLPRSDIQLHLQNPHVDFKRPNRIPDVAVRISSCLPYGFGFVILYGLFTHHESLPLYLIAFLIGLFAGLFPLVSYSDILGFLFPRRFKRFADGRRGTDNEAARALLVAGISDWWQRSRRTYFEK